MSILINDDATLANFSAASKPEDVLGRDGKLLGRFIPVNQPKMTFPEIGLTDEELDGRLNDSTAPTYTPEQVMARLRELRECSR
jgi:hypothetical protein